MTTLKFKHHRSGHVYVLEQLVRLKATGETMVIYRREDDGPGPAWTRPATEFFGFVPPGEGRPATLRRFIPVLEPR